MMEDDLAYAPSDGSDHMYRGGIPDGQFDHTLSDFVDEALAPSIVPSNDSESGDVDHHQRFSREEGGKFDGLLEDYEETYATPISLSPEKRRATSELQHRPFKRQKGPVNLDYLDMLNVDIQDAAKRLTFEHDDDWRNRAFSLPTAQFGLTVWDVYEKRLLYEALSRLGPSDTRGIAAAIGSKSVIEVEHYLNMVHHMAAERAKEQNRPILQIAEIPAAVELSQQCCHALDEAADVIAVAQERRENDHEEKVWGKYWDITPELARKIGPQTITGPPRPRQLAFAQLFNVPRWLDLSAGIFMNSAVPSGNWKYIEESPPSVWASTMEDFHSVALSITRRLVQTTIFIAMSRLRAKQELDPRVRNVVRQEDALAAISALNMEDTRRKFWTQASRRLRLNIHDDEAGEEESDEDSSSEVEHMTYNEVEDALEEEEDEDDSQGLANHPETIPETADPDNGIPQTIAVHSLGILENSNGLGALNRAPPEEEEDDDEEDAGGNDPADAERREIIKEANEILLYTATDVARTARGTKALHTRIAHERQQEDYARQCDEHASSVAEADLWALLRKPGPQGVPEVPKPEPVARSNQTVGELVSLNYPWRSRTKFYSEWETMQGGEEVGDQEVNQLGQDNANEVVEEDGRTEGQAKLE